MMSRHPTLSFPSPGCFDQGALNSVRYAEHEALYWNYPEVDRFHMLYGLVHHERQVGVGLLHQLGLSASRLAHIEHIVQQTYADESRQALLLEQPPSFSSSLHIVFSKSVQIGRVLHAPTIGVDHLLATLLTTDDECATTVRTVIGLDTKSFQVKVMDSIALTPTSLTEILSQPAPAFVPRSVSSWLDGSTLGRSDVRRFVPYPNCFAKDSLHALEQARKLAGPRRPVELGHLLIALVQGLAERGSQVIRDYPIDVKRFSNAIKESLANSSKPNLVATIGRMRFNHEVYFAIQWAVDLAESIAASSIAAEWLFLAAVESAGEETMSLLARLGIRSEALRECIMIGANRNPKDLIVNCHSNLTSRLPCELEALIYGEKSRICRLVDWILALVWRKEKLSVQRDFE